MLVQSVSLEITKMISENDEHANLININPLNLSNTLVSFLKQKFSC